MMNALLLGHRATAENAGLVPYIGVAFGTLF
jgi:hypothetical protein